MCKLKPQSRKVHVDKENVQFLQVFCDLPFFFLLWGHTQLCSGTICGSDDQTWLRHVQGNTQPTVLLLQVPEVNYLYKKMSVINITFNLRKIRDLKHQTKMFVPIRGLQHQEHKGLEYLFPSPSWSFPSIAQGNVRIRW